MTRIEMTRHYIPKTKHTITHIVDAPSMVVPVLRKKIIHTITRIFSQYEFTLKTSHFICTYPVTQAPTRSLRDAPEACLRGLRMHRTTEERRINYHKSHNEILHFPHILMLFIKITHIQLSTYYRKENTPGPQSRPTRPPP